VTKGSGDQGIDVIAEKAGIKIGIQAKCYSSKVTNKAVQEVTAALSYYSCDKGIVISNNYFTESAISLAQSNNIVLWDRDSLKRKLEEFFLNLLDLPIPGSDEKT
jgi:restriction system protein